MITIYKLSESMDQRGVVYSMTVVSSNGVHKQVAISEDTYVTLRALLLEEVDAQSLRGNTPQFPPPGSFQPLRIDQQNVRPPAQPLVSQPVQRQPVEEETFGPGSTLEIAAEHLRRQQQQQIEEPLDEGEQVPLRGGLGGVGQL